MSKSSETALSNPRMAKAQIVAPPEPRWLVLVMLFVLMGALAVPMLWRSPHFSRPAKIVLAVVAVLQTAVVLVILVVAVQWFLAQATAIVTGH